MFGLIKALSLSMDQFFKLLYLLLLLVDGHLHEEHLSLLFDEFLHLLTLYNTVFEGVVGSVYEVNFLLFFVALIQNLSS